MTDELEQMTPNQRRALDKALAALEAMASIWASEIRLTDMSQKIANVTDPTMRAKRIAAMVEQAFIEGAYRHYLDHKDGILHVDALEAANARIAELEAERDAQIAAAGKKAVAWECSSPAGEKPALAFLTSKKPTVEHYEEQGWRVTPLCLCAPTAALAQPLEAQADARDAWRYRWLRDWQADASDFCCASLEIFLPVPARDTATAPRKHSECFDAAIDAAMSQKSGEQE